MEIASSLRGQNNSDGHHKLGIRLGFKLGTSTLGGVSWTHTARVMFETQHKSENLHAD